MWLSVFSRAPLGSRGVTGRRCYRWWGYAPGAWWFTQCLNNGRGPRAINGKTRIIKVLHKKKEDRSGCNNYSEISLVAHAGKSSLKNRHVPPEQLLRGSGNSPEEHSSAAFDPYEQWSACCSPFAVCASSDERGKSPCTCMLQRSAESVRLCRPRAGCCCRTRSHASAYQRRRLQLFASSTKKA